MAILYSKYVWPLCTTMSCNLLVNILYTDIDIKVTTQNWATVLNWWIFFFFWILLNYNQVVIITAYMKPLWTICLLASTITAVMFSQWRPELYSWKRRSTSCWKMLTTATTWHSLSSPRLSGKCAGWNILVSWHKLPHSNPKWNIAVLPKRLLLTSHKWITVFVFWNICTFLPWVSSMTP